MNEEVVDKGLIDKYNVFRRDGRDRQGDKHRNCRYFVLDVSHDPFAIPAILAYAEACREKKPVLSENLIEMAYTHGEGVSKIPPAPWTVEIRGDAVQEYFIFSSDGNLVAQTLSEDTAYWIATLPGILLSMTKEEMKNLQYIIQFNKQGKEA